MKEFTIWPIHLVQFTRSKLEGVIRVGLKRNRKETCLHDGKKVLMVLMVLVKPRKFERENEKESFDHCASP